MKGEVECGLRKRKSNHSLSLSPFQTAKNLSLLVQFDEYELFRGLNFRKLLKAPTDHCFALRVSGVIQQLV